MELVPPDVLTGVWANGRQQQRLNLQHRVQTLQHCIPSGTLPTGNIAALAGVIHASEVTISDVHAHCLLAACYHPS